MSDEEEEEASSIVFQEEHNESRVVGLYGDVDEENSKEFI